MACLTPWGLGPQATLSGAPGVPLGLLPLATGNSTGPGVLISAVGTCTKDMLGGLGQVPAFLWVAKSHRVESCPVGESEELGGNGICGWETLAVIITVISQGE